MDEVRKMKKRFGLGVILLLHCLFLFGMTAMAAEEDFNYTEVTGGIEITGYHGSDTDVVIPEQIDGKPVVSIGRTAFYVESKVKSVHIPASVKSIGEKAFSYSSSIQKVTFAGNGLETIGDRAFESCRSLSQFDFPTSVKSIGECAFIYCPLTGKLDFSKSNVTFSRGVFFQCKNITEVALPQGMTKIPDTLFDGCQNLQKVTIPGNTLKTIEHSAFRDCDSLTDITIPDSVTTIETYAFSFCKKLTTITLSPNVKTIEYYAFGGSGLKKVKCQYNSYAYKYFKTMSGITVKATGTYLKKTSATIYVGEKLTLKLANDNGKTSFKSSKKKVASVSSKGVVKGLKKGKTKITAKNGGITSTCTITVKPLTLNYKKASITEGFTLKLSLSGSGKTTWSSSDSNIASVSSKGKVTAKSSGTATITAKRNGKKFSCKVTVQPNERSFSTVGRSSMGNMTYLQLSKLRKVGSNYEGTFLVTNNTAYKAVSLVSANIKISAGGSTFLTKNLSNIPVSIPAYSSDTITVTFSGGDIHKSNVNLRSSSISFNMTNGTVAYIY